MVGSESWSCSEGSGESVRCSLILTVYPGIGG
ncbi:hypothetical protein FB388_4374 [Pseudonocardia cypriaca]|uniref:Uncharacterized protein n=1 Tax=Pseudonocardia cypriaca TaxID=882449 RepID=A0A543FTJ8_9PSEU|nr:hypothetical protein FB388_4374 [Pseudonocardia cypriaca]